jgi:hypothetical protein
VIDRGYFVLQAATLLKLAQTTTDPEMSAASVEKATDHDASALADLTPLAPDMSRQPGRKAASFGRLRAAANEN